MSFPFEGGEIIRPSGIIVPDLRDPISRARRTPSHCLYCVEQATSREHIIPEALGGRLRANILCPRHNRELGAFCDEGIIRELHSLAHFLGIARQTGRKGAALYGKTDEGSKIKLDPGGHPQLARLQVSERAPSGRIQRATGSLHALDDLKGKGAFTDEGGPVLAYKQKGPYVTIETKIGPEVERGVLKIALHFVAGFLIDVALSDASLLGRYIFGEEMPYGEYVRFLTLEERFFPRSWPPHHRVAAYRAGNETYVTVLLFGMHGFNVRLPLEVPLQLRYIQPLEGSDLSPVLEANDHPRTFDWDTFFTADDFEAFKANLSWRHDYIMDVALYRQLRERCSEVGRRATLAALGSATQNVLAYYRAELQLDGFSAEQIAILMHYGRELALQGKEPWDIPFGVIR